MKTKGSILIQRDANKWPGILESSPRKNFFKSLKVEKPLKRLGNKYTLCYFPIGIESPLAKFNEGTE